MTEIDQLHIDQEATIRAKINSVSTGITKEGNEFLAVNIEDLTDAITAKVWDVNAVDIVVGSVYELFGKTVDFKGKKQFHIEKAVLIEDDLTVAKYFKRAPESEETIRKAIYGYIEEIEHEQVKLLVKRIYETYDEELFVYPAATQNHHAYVGGLSYHTMTMMQVAKSLLPIYPFIDQSLLFAGVLLHDFAKVIELSQARSPEYTLEGNLIGHLVMGAGIVKDIATELNINEDLSLYIQHMIISHHGRKEWGSPQRPHLPEAELLFFIDSLDSKMETIRLEFENTEVGDWTKRIPVLDGRSMYRHK